jgi:hypothetical protein
LVLSLPELQRSFAAAVFDGAIEALVPQIRADGIAANARLGIYQNNLREGFHKALAAEFPVIQRLVGDDYFRQLAREFQIAQPSRHGDLYHVGQPFERYLYTRYRATEYAYLPDVAALEWARQEAYVAADASPLPVAALAAADPAVYGRLRFEMHPSCRLLKSSYPVSRIWTSNQPGAEGEETIDLGSGGEQLLVWRTAAGVEFQQLSAGHYSWLEALAKRATLAEAVDVATAQQSEFDLGTALRRAIATGVIVGLAVESEHP